LTEVETLDLSPAGGVYRTTYGPAFFEVLKRLPASTQFVACLNLGNDSLEIASTQAQAAVEALGSQLYALECASRRAAGAWLSSSETSALTRRAPSCSRQRGLLQSQSCTSDGSA
jgi:hypothetical protein